MTVSPTARYFTEGRMTVELADNVSAVVALDKIKAKIQEGCDRKVLQVRDPHTMHYPPKQWPRSPRIVV